MLLSEPSPLFAGVGQAAAAAAGEEAAAESEKGDDSKGGDKPLLVLGGEIL